MNILSFFLVLRGQKCNGILSFHSDTFFRLDNRFVLKEIRKEVDQSRGCDDISLLLLGKLSKDCSEKKTDNFHPNVLYNKMFDILQDLFRDFTFTYLC